MCERVGTVIICGRGRRQKLGTCQQCYTRPASVLCDGPVNPDPSKRYRMPGGDKTCSKPLCRECAVHAPPDGDFCAEHAAPEKRRLAL